MSQRLALRMGEAADSMGVSHDFFTANVAPELRLVRRGRVKLVTVTELQRWLDENSALALAGL